MSASMGLKPESAVDNLREDPSEKLPSLLTIGAAASLHVAAIVVLTGHFVPMELEVALLVWMAAGWLADTVHRVKKGTATLLAVFGTLLPAALIFLAIAISQSWVIVCAAILQFVLLVCALPVSRAVVRSEWDIPMF